MLYPLLFKPVYKDYIWGGSRIPKMFNRSLPPGTYAESWEISDRLDGMSVVENGPLIGQTLRDVFTREKEALMGKDSHFSYFPLLIKLIDAKENLSIQVHPDKKSVKTVGGEAKNEAWVILESDEKSIIYAGLKKGYSTDEIVQRMGSAKILPAMNALSVTKGDVISIPAKRLHGIGSGSLVFEVQQNSNTTYRVYDFNRNRPLHIAQAKNAIQYEDHATPRITPKKLEECHAYEKAELIRTPYFILEKWKINRSIPWEKLDGKFELLFIAEGETSIAPTGRTLLLPASSPPIEIETSGTTLFRVYLPDSI